MGVYFLGGAAAQSCEVNGGWEYHQFFLEEKDEQTHCSSYQV